MALMSPILRLRRAFRSMGAEPEVVDSVVKYGFARPETELMFREQMASMREQTARLQQQMAELRTQILVAIFMAAGLIIAAVGLMLALTD